LRAYFRRCAIVLSVSVAIFAILLIVARIEFGSVTHAVGWLQGERVWVSPQTLDVGSLEPGDHGIQIRVVNFYDRPVRIVGGTGQCSCLSFVDLPQQLKARESRYIDLIASVGGKAPKSPDNLYRFVLFTDAPGSKRVVGAVRWVQK
jgi:hypothetical protein